ncbi:hypothetical protein INT43_001777, partial [Umbelopsis isabellina]
MSTDKNHDANGQMRFIDYTYMNFTHAAISADPIVEDVPVDSKHKQVANIKPLEPFQPGQTCDNVAGTRLSKTSSSSRLPQVVQHMGTSSLYSSSMHSISDAIYDIGMMLGPNTAHSQTPSASGLDYPTGYYQEMLSPEEAQPTNKQYLIDNALVQDDMIRLSPIKFCSNCFTTETPSWRRCSEGKNLLCNACGLYEKLHHTHRKICLHPDGSTKIVRHNTAEAQGGCAVCGTTFASLWRKLDRKCYCNACVIRFGIGHTKRMSLPHIWSDAVSSQRTVDYPSYQ